MKTVIEAIDSPPIYNYPDQEVELRIGSTLSWLTAQGQFVQEGSGWYLPIACSLTARVLYIPSFELDATVDAPTPYDITTRYTAKLYSTKGKFLGIFPDDNLEEFRVPATLNLTWNIIKQFNNPVLRFPQPLSAPSTQQVLDIITDTNGDRDYASASLLGLVKLDRDPDIPSEPIALGENSLRLLDFVTQTDPRVFSTVGLGINDTATFATAMNSVAATGGKLYILGQVALTNLDIPSNVSLDFTAGGSIKVITGNTVRIYGTIVADPGRRIFFNALAGQGSIRFTEAGNNGPSNAAPPGRAAVMREFFFEWWGAKADNKIASGALNADAFEEAGHATPNGTTLRFASPGGYYYISRGITWDHWFNKRVVGGETGLGIPDAISTPVIVYNGVDGGVAISWRNVYNSLLQGFVLYLNNGVNNFVGAGVGIHMDFDAGVGYPQLTSHCAIKGVQINTINLRPNTRGIVIGHLDGSDGPNNEHHLFEDVIIIGYGSAIAPLTGTVGFQQGISQAKGIVYNRCSVAGMAQAFGMVGSANLYNTRINNCETVVFAGSIFDASIISQVDIEEYKYFWLESGATGTQSPVTIMAVRGDATHAAMTSSSTAVIQHQGGFGAGNLIFIGCTFFEGTKKLGPYFTGNPSGVNAPSITFIDCLLNAVFGTANNIEVGFADNLNVTVINGPSRQTFGSAAGQFTYGGETDMKSTPGFPALQSMVKMVGNAFSGGERIAYGGGAFSIGGLIKPSLPTATNVGVGGSFRRDFTIIARDSLGRRSLAANNADGGATSINGNATLTGSNFIRLTWLAQFPVPELEEIYDTNPSDTQQGRLIGSIVPSGGPIETFDVVVNPSGPYVVGFRPPYSEDARIIYRAKLILPNEITFASGDTTPSVGIGSRFATANAGATSHSNYDDGVEGDIIYVRIADPNTTILNNANIITGTGGNIAAVNGAVYVFMKGAGQWHRTL